MTRLTHDSTFERKLQILASSSVYETLGRSRMRTTMIGPNYRWCGRARDILVSPSKLARSLASLLSFFPSCPFLSTRVRTRSAYVVYKSACFLAGVYTHFPPSFLSPPSASLSPSLSLFFLHSPPRPKKIKAHLIRWLSLSHTIRRVMRRAQSKHSAKTPPGEGRDRKKERRWQRRQDRFAKWRTNSEDDQRIAPRVRNWISISRSTSATSRAVM